MPPVRSIHDELYLTHTGKDAEYWKTHDPIDLPKEYWAAYNKLIGLPEDYVPKIIPHTEEARGNHMLGARWTEGKPMTLTRIGKSQYHLLHWTNWVGADGGVVNFQIVRKGDEANPIDPKAKRIKVTQMSPKGHPFKFYECAAFAPDASKICIKLPGAPLWEYMFPFRWPDELEALKRTIPHTCCPPDSD
ncbi:hypothetical protein MIND_01194600 [Mycena indigotica]|uniref:Uncharacterized protein n=1 Tax=Mycena indigotica TaxID=2126181 RepID=A0A8H6S4W5_9AGAR|nr:uncharacterized protein MIND_01194600 [Mycena indigotica]KAF7292954.1 hypothetical protein MIND_01194600 [Mycena indigotica]